MKKPSIIVLLAATFLFVFQSGDASPQQIPDQIVKQVPEGVPSQEAFDKLLRLVSAQTEAIKFLATDIEELEARILLLENPENNNGKRNK